MAEFDGIKRLEERLFSYKVGLIDTSNLILSFGLTKYRRLIEYIKRYNPKEIYQLADASLKHRLWERFKISKQQFVPLQKEFDLLVCPANTECDGWLIQIALDHPDHFLLTNDALSDYCPFWTQQLNIVKCMIINSKFYFDVIKYGKKVVEVKV